MAQPPGKDVPLETEICHNCKREVPQQNYLMHVAHCARNMAVCPVCGDAVPKARLKEHRQQQHSLVECPACRNKVQSGAMEHHRASSCGRRTIACQHCELELPQVDLEEHEYHCGARTDRCDECGELVMLRYQKLHLDSNHGFLKLSDEPGPTASWEAPTKNQNGGSLNMRPLLNSLGGSATPAMDTPKGKCFDEGPSEASPPLRDAPRTFVPAYDASDDLRAKVKLVRHDLNNIKNSYLVQGEERARMLQRGAAPRGPDLPATNKTPRSRFVTNLVPYEKNKSYQVNALPLEEVVAVPGPLQPLGNPATAPGPTSGFFNYLGAREGGPPITSAAPLRSVVNGSNTGAVPRPSKKKHPAPPIPLPPNQQHDKKRPDEVALPCEFCGKMIGASQLVLHETACRPDLAQLKVPPIGAEGAAAVGAPPASPEVQLPCEFCSDLFPASKLLSHQALCDG